MLLQRSNNGIASPNIFTCTYHIQSEAIGDNILMTIIVSKEENN